MTIVPDLTEAWETNVMLVEGTRGCFWTGLGVSLIGGLTGRADGEGTYGEHGTHDYGFDGWD